MAKAPCRECGQPCRGTRCQGCTNAAKAARIKATTRYCLQCNAILDRGAIGLYCRHHKGRSSNLAAVKEVLEEANLVAPSPIAMDEYEGECIIIGCAHVPFHDAPWMLKVCKAADMLGIKTLVIAGDAIMGDRISKYDLTGKTVSLANELLVLQRVFLALLTVFDKIIWVMGNHDQRIERLIASAAVTREGRNMLDLIAAQMGQTFDAENAGELAMSYLESFVASPQVRVVPFPELIINKHFRVVHGAGSRIPPNGSRRMSHRYRQSVIAAHDHLFGAGFDDSGEDVVIHTGYSADASRWRYQREKPSNWPAQVHGMVAIMVDGEGMPGYVVPIAEHPRWFSLERLEERLRVQREKQ